MKRGATPEQIEHMICRVEQLGLKAHPIYGTERTVIAAVDKRTGQLFQPKPNERFDGLSHFRLEGDPEKKAIAIRLQRETVTLNFTDKPLTATNPTAKVQFSRVVLEGGKLADVSKNVMVTPAAK